MRFYEQIIWCFVSLRFSWQAELLRLHSIKFPQKLLRRSEVNYRSFAQAPPFRFETRTCKCVIYIHKFIIGLNDLSNSIFFLVCVYLFIEERPSWVSILLTSRDLNHWPYSPITLQWTRPCNISVEPKSNNRFEQWINNLYHDRMLSQVPRMVISVHLEYNWRHGAESFLIGHRSLSYLTFYDTRRFIGMFTKGLH
jgi:hypothetical protein